MKCNNNKCVLSIKHIRDLQIFIFFVSRRRKNKKKVLYDTTIAEYTKQNLNFELLILIFQ